MNKRRIVIKHGEVCGFADELSFDSKNMTLTEYEKVRVSRIVPLNIALKMAFIALRLITPDNSKIAAWTRLWKCQWNVLIDDQKYGPFNKRVNAIAFEKEKIYQQGKLNHFNVGNN